MVGTDQILVVCVVCFHSWENYKASWKDAEMLSQVFFPWKEGYKTHPDDEQQLTVHYFLEKTSSWLPCRSESIKTELLTIAFLSCWSLGLNPNFIRHEKKRIMWTMGVLEVDLGLMLRGCKSCQSVWSIGSHALVPSAELQRSSLFSEAWCATWGQNLSACGANVSEEAKVQSIIYTEICAQSCKESKFWLEFLLVQKRSPGQLKIFLLTSLLRVLIPFKANFNWRREFESSWDISI